MRACSPPAASRCSPDPPCSTTGRRTPSRLPPGGLGSSSGAPTASPVPAQQSLRELTLTSRTYEEVLDASTWAVFREGWRDAWGADGDHLKTAEWVRRGLALGDTMITADVSDFIHGE